MSGGSIPYRPDIVSDLDIIAVDRVPLLKRITYECERIYFVWGDKGGVWDRHNYNITLNYCDCDKPFT